MEINYSCDCKRLLLKVQIKQKFKFMNQEFEETYEKTFDMKKDNADNIKNWIESVKKQTEDLQAKLDKIADVIS
ncbi:hypothetical protein [Acidianus bottle-shaped virus 3 strain ABV3]|uniref:PH domain-containing protein n=1 Tax=Acidianus bottle-shaped virus 3 strain ABV3 TaxID=1732174 RepID=A0A0N9P727_9VIRU|nr:hypothetical protein AVU00_gp15 [Acidianus bottle-shaped virus 3 strain ABV3]ALG96817.1 hypothetical protein [Acidianus bottle-shaped virus 3 strain ABV3]